MDTIRVSRLVVFLVLLLSFLPSKRSAAQQVTTTGNAFVSADVDNASGIIGISIAGTFPKEVLTNQTHSYLTVEVGNVFYTNNDNGPSILEPSDTTATPDQVVNIGSFGKTHLIADTVQTIWQPKGPSAFDIIQDVYPVTGVNSGQIVYKWSIVNHEDTALNSQVQFLLDLETSTNSPIYSTEIPAVTTRNGFNTDVWQDITGTPYFLTSEFDLCTDMPNFPGVLGAGFTEDGLAPQAMGLMKPSHIAVVDWVTIAPTFLWGFPPSLAGSALGDNDNAILFQWPPSEVGSKSEQELGSMSFGTAPCQPITNENLDALLLHPDHIVWNGSAYVPNHFPVEAIVWNPNDSASASSASANQRISNSISGLPGPVRIASLDSTQFLHSGLLDPTIPHCSSAFATWEDTVLQSALTNCSGDSSYDISVAVSASGISQPVFLGPCVCPIIVDCQGKPDTGIGFPRFTVLSRTGSYDSSTCNARIVHGEATDLRMCAQCDVKSVSALHLQNMTFAIEDSTNWKFAVSVIDSMQNGSATILALDGTGETDTAQFLYCTIPDRKAPLVQLRGCVDSVGGPCFYRVTDTQAWDRGLDTIYFTDMNGVTIAPPDSVHARRIAGFSVKGVGSFCV